MTQSPARPSESLTYLAGISPVLQKEVKDADDQAWIDVIQHMDSIYADLVQYQVELEEKNAALEDAQRFIQSVICSISDILIVCDINGQIQQVNDALENLVGQNTQQLAGQPLSILFSEHDQAMVAEFPSKIRSGTITDCEVDLCDIQQHSLPMAINCSARFDHKNRLSGFVITGRPLSELRKAYAELHQAHEDLKKAQQQLIQSEKMASLGRLVAGVAHELNNPISFLYANMFAMQSYEKKFKTYLNAVHRDIPRTEREQLRAELNIDHMMDDIAPLVEGSLEGAERVRDIVNNLRKFTTPQEQQQQTFDLIAVLKRASAWVFQAQTQKITLNTDYPDTLNIRNSEGHVHQILINLIQNAVDALEGIHNPQLSLSVNQVQGKIKICIHDNGRGIPPENLARIFDPFFTTKAVGNGTGLGLYISYGLAVEQCAGNLSAENHPEGGAIFTLELPGNHPS